MSPFDLVNATDLAPPRPWPHRVLSRSDWAAMASARQPGPDLGLVALWADTNHVHALLIDDASDCVLPVAVAVEAGHYPALSSAWPIAAWFERLISDLWGHVADGGHDLRPWLDHGQWSRTQPLASRPGPPSSAAEPTAFLVSDAKDLMQIPHGPVHDLIGEAAHIRLTARGGTVLRAESRLGYTHKGVLTLMRGKSPRAAARFAARLAGDATVAHSLAFARATEAALDRAPPPRALVLRAAMAELERIAGHLDTLAVQADGLGFSALHAECGLHREHLLRAVGAAFGHRLMMDCIVPGGVAIDIAADGSSAILAALRELDAGLAALRRRCDKLLAHVEGLGKVTPAAVAAWAAGGVVGRASGRAFDARRFDTACPTPAPCTERAGDVAARCRVRMAQIADSIRLVRTLLDELPEGSITVGLPADSGEGIGCAESVRGDVWHWLRIDHGQIAAAFPRDPGWALWPLAETAVAGCRTEEVDVILHSFGLAASPVDL
jgi:Ni,Fe-hydrogenase III large subunit